MTSNLIVTNTIELHASEARLQLSLIPIRVLRITAPCAPQLPLKFCFILTQCHLDKYLKALHKPVLTSSYEKALKATCLRLFRWLMKEQQREPRIEVPCFPWNFPTVLPTTTTKYLRWSISICSLPVTCTGNRAHTALFQELLVLFLLF